MIIVYPCGIVLDAFAEKGISESWTNQWELFLFSKCVFSLSLSSAACFDIVNKDVSPTNYSEFLLDLALQKAKWANKRGSLMTLGLGMF